MQVVDANILLYAVNRAAAQHERSRAWLDAALRRTETVAFAWTAILAFLRLATNPAAFPRPLTAEEACGAVQRWLDQPPAVVLEPTARHATLLGGLLAATGTAGNLANDAHLAAFALEHGAEVVSFDRDFQRFAGVRLFIP